MHWDDAVAAVTHSGVQLFIHLFGRLEALQEDIGLTNLPKNIRGDNNLVLVLGGQLLQVTFGELVALDALVISPNLVNERTLEMEARGISFDF